MIAKVKDLWVCECGAWVRTQSHMMDHLCSCGKQEVRNLNEYDMKALRKFAKVSGIRKPAATKAKIVAQIEGVV